MQSSVQIRDPGKKPRRLSNPITLGCWSRLPQADANQAEEVNNSAETEEVFFALAQAVEQRDLYTASHCERLAFISVAMGMISGLPRECLLVLYRGGYVHDIGKVGIPDAILFKPGKLTPEEWEVMRTHTTRGVEI